MRIQVIGTRGFPFIQGGVEKHCEALYPLIVQRANKVEVYRRTPYINQRNRMKDHSGVTFSDLWAPRSKNFEAIIHSILASLVSLFRRPDVVHIHNIGPSLVLPILKSGGLKTVVTYHSKNYQHDKWGFFAKIMLKAGEKCVGALADEVIFISETQARLFSWNNKTYIPNGVSIQTPSISTSYLTQIGVEPREYLLAVARFAPEKGLHDLISAFKLIDTKRKLVIAGDADHETEYSRNLRHLASQDNRIILTGYITGEPLNQVYSHARLFVLPSYHEGLPIALLEAMSYGLPVLVSDIPANREVGLPGDRYFRCGDVTDLKEKMLRLLGNDISIIEQERLRKLIEEKYNWDEIAEQTINVYRKALKTTETRRNVGSKVLVGARVKTP